MKIWNVLWKVLCMLLNKADVVCGQPAMIVRDFLSLIANGEYVIINSDYFDTVGLSVTDSQALILDLLDEGYIQQITERSFFGGEKGNFPGGLTTTAKGQQVACARFGKRMKRKAVERLLKTVLDRAQQTSEHSVFIFEVNKIYVFGSYLDETGDSYGDLDLVLDIRSKKTPFFGSDPVRYEFDELMNMYHQDGDGRHKAIEQISGRFNEWYRLHDEGLIDCKPAKPGQYSASGWDLSAVPHYLKRRNHRISIHSMEEFALLVTNEKQLVYDAELSGSLI